MKNSVRLPAFAKVNLCLHVLGRRADGYHELRTLFQSISLHDVLELHQLRARAISLEIDEPSLPAGRENLVYRAIDAMRRELNYRGGIHARLSKQIPVARGLGGGSSDAAAAIIGMLRLTGREAAARARHGNWRGARRGRALLPFRRTRAGQSAAATSSIRCPMARNIPSSSSPQTASPSALATPIAGFLRN